MDAMRHTHDFVGLSGKKGRKERKTTLGNEVKSTDGKCVAPFHVTNPWSILSSSKGRHKKQTSDVSQGHRQTVWCRENKHLCIWPNNRCCVMFHSPSLAVRPTQDNTLCSLPTGLINMCCKISTEAYFSWDYSSGNLLILVCVSHYEVKGVRATWSTLAHFWCGVCVCVDWVY